MKIIEENCCSDASASVDFSMSVFSQRQLTDAQIQEWNIDVNRLSSQFAAFGNAFLGKKKTKRTSNAEHSTIKSPKNGTRIETNGIQWYLSLFSFYYKAHTQIGLKSFGDEVDFYWIFHPFSFYYYLAIYGCASVWVVSECASTRGTEHHTS